MFCSGVARIWCEGVSPFPLAVGSAEGAVPAPQKIF